MSIFKSHDIELQIENFYFSKSLEDILVHVDPPNDKYNMLGARDEKKTSDIFFYSDYVDCEYCVVFENYDWSTDQELEQWLDVTFTNSKKVPSSDMQYIRVYLHDEEDLMAARLGPFNDNIFAVITNSHKY